MPISSPFPGMDPWLEQHWGDIHHSIVTYTRDQLQPKLPGGLRARMQKRVLAEIPIVEYGILQSLGNGSGGLAVAEPIVVNLEDDVPPQGFIEVIDSSTGKVITIIEVLSPANKAGGYSQKMYLKKQQEIIDASASLVEIDLLRGGERIISVRPSYIPRSHRTAYQISVRRGWKPFQGEVCAAPLEQPLPTIRIPLRETDPDATLELQKLIEQAYRNGGYDDLDYSVDPDPPLGRDEAIWADQLLRGKGLR